MTRNTIFGIILSLLLVGFLQFPVGVSDSATSWKETYGGTGDDRAYSVIQTSGGGYAIAGSTRSYGAGESDFWLVKTDAGGNVQWSRTYGGTSVDYAYSVVQTGDGGYALAGYTYSFGAGGGDFWLVKTDASGNKQWDKTYGGTSMESCDCGVIQRGDGGYALAGVTRSYGAGKNDFWLVKTDASGNVQWNKTYGGTDEDRPESFVQTNDGGYALAGVTLSYAGPLGPKSNNWLVKTDASGNVQWNRVGGGTGYDFAYSVIQTIDGGYMLVGDSDSFSTGDDDILFSKMDASGNEVWSRISGSQEDDYGNSVVQTSDGGYAIAGGKGIYYDNGWTIKDFWLIKIDASGNTLWDRTYGGTGDDVAWSMIKTSDGGYALAGITNSFGAGGDDFWLVKTDSQGDGAIFPDLILIIVIASVIVIICASTVIIVYSKKRSKVKTHAQLPPPSLPPPPPPPPPPP